MDRNSIRSFRRTVNGSSMLRAAAVAFVSLLFMFPAFSQDDEDSVPAKVTDANNKAAGKASLVLDIGRPPTNFGYIVYLYLNGDRLLLIRPESGSRSSVINCTFREYKIDNAEPKNSSKWNETGSGTATLKMPASGDVQSITATVNRTRKVVGNDEVVVTEKVIKYVITLD